MLHYLDENICHQMKELALLGKGIESVDLLCDWWNDQNSSLTRASHFGIFVRKRGDIFHSLTVDDPDERRITDLLASDFLVEMESAFIEFRYDRVEGGVRYTYNMDDERIECSMACLETYRWWTSTAVTAYVESGEKSRTTALAFS